MALKVFDSFDRRLWLNGPRELIPRDALRRARGVHPHSTRSIRTRSGSVELFPISSHSLTRFAGARYQGSGDALYRNGLSIQAGLNGNRLAFIRMPPTAGIVDYLFVSGGGSLFKVRSDGNTSRWGIVKPPNGMVAADGGAGALSGTYKYHVTFKNTVTGHRSDPNPTAVTVGPLTNRSVALTNIPTSTDLQVDAREIWRTVSNGAAFFLLTTIFGNTITTLNDNVPDSSLSSTALPFDNAPPDATFADVAGPHVSRAWWTRDSVAGRRGRIYYSGVGRPESLVGFISPSNDDDPMQKVVVWGGSLWGFSVEHLFIVLGDTEPFVAIEVAGSPGTINPYTVIPTPIGIIYQAHESVRLFDGARSSPISPDAISLLLHGENIENLNSFVGKVATQGRDEYYISDEQQTLAVSLTDGTWRDLGIGVRALFYEEDTQELIASFANRTYRLEVNGVLLDGTTPIPFEAETAGEIIGFKQDGVIQQIVVDINTRGQTVTPRLILDGQEIVLADINTTSRTLVERPVGRKGRIVGVRFTANLSDAIEIFKVGIEHAVGTPTLARV